MVVAVPPETEAKPLSHALMEDDYLILDAQTLQDLEIFGSGKEGESLFHFCDLTRTEGGARVLRRRMELPWANAEPIESTQKALSFIIAQRQAFSDLPSAYVASRVDHYLNESLPIVTGDNVLEFGFGALALWGNHERHYISIVHGSKLTSSLMQTLKNFVAQDVLSSAGGVLAALIDEMRELLKHPRLAAVTNQVRGNRAWKVLRLDQVFRLHETGAIARLLQLVYEVDALVSMADVTQKHDFVLPDVETGPLRVYGEGLSHPFVERAVANPVELNQDRRLLFLTGPNMAGKTTYLRAFATALYLGHLGMGVPATRFSFVPVQRLFSSISLSDDLRGGISYFRAEALRVKAIAQAIAEGERVVALLDEPFKGTNIKDAFDASLAILERFAIRNDCLFMFSSHLIELSEQISVTDQIDCRFFEADESEGRLRFDYQLRPGVSSQRLGMRVLHEEGVFDLLDRKPDIQ